MMSRISHIVGGSLRHPGPKFTPAQKWVIALGLLVLALGLANLGRAGVALHYNALLPDLPLTVPLTYLAAMGGFWGLILVVCTVGLVRFRPWGRWGTMAAVTLYEIHVWVNHLLFDANDYARQTRPCDSVLTMLLLALIWVSLNLHSVRKAFSRPAPHCAGGSVTANPKEKEK